MEDEYTCHSHQGHPEWGCAELNGTMWVFTDEIPDFLTFQGVAVWDLMRNISIVHSPTEEANCRCWLTITVNLADLDEKIRQLTNLVVSNRALPNVPAEE